MAAIVRWIFLLVFFLPALSQATTYYVATTGSDSNDGLSESTPKLTVRHCVSIMVAGDTCYVRGGTYTETDTIRFGTTGTQANPIKLLAYPNESPVITWATQTSNDRILILNTAGDEVAMGWITISGFEIHHGYNGIKFHSVHNSTISHNWLHDHAQSAILGIGGHHDVITRNILNHNGPIATDPTSTLSHGIYLHGSDMTISNNLIYDNLGYGIQQNGSSSSVFNSAIHPSADFALAQRWIVVNNTIAYNINWAGIVVWGNDCDSSRYENNIIYENATTLSTGSLQGIDCVGCSGSTGIGIKNNHFYASGSGGQVGIDTTFNADLVSSGNVTNVSAPAFVNGGSNSLPASPDFRLTASSPVNIALANEFPNNDTNVVGAYKTIGACTASITTNKMTLTCPLSTATPVQNLSSTGVSIGCTGTSCPGSHSVSSVSRVVGSTTQIEIVIAGIAGDACVSTNQNWNVSYDAALGTWSGNDNIGNYPGIHQKFFSFTSLSATNACTGSGPTSYPSGYHIWLKFDDGSGINANDESANSLDGTLTNGPTWGAGKTGSGVVTTGGTQHVAIPYGNGIDPSSQSLTIAFGVNIPAGQEALSRNYFGAPLGTNQRFYISTSGGTWRLGVQSSNDATAGNIAVTSGWHNVCLVANSGTDVATLYIDGVASTSAGAVKSYTSYSLAGDFDLGRIADVTTNAAAGTYDDFLLYTSVKDCAAIASAFNAGVATPSGTFAQAAIQFQGVILDPTSTPIVIGPAVQTIEVPAGGGAVLLFQIHCQNISDCSSTSFRLVYAKNGSGVWTQIPAIDSDGTWMWGSSSDAHMNTGVRSTRLTGSCTVTNGTTQVIPGATPTVDLPQDGCTIMAYIVRVGSTQAGNYFDYKLQFDGGVDLSIYTQTARLEVVNPLASGVGF
jgi:hypothetical protein